MSWCVAELGKVTPLQQSRARHTPAQKPSFKKQRRVSLHPGILGPDYFRDIAAVLKTAATAIPPAPPNPKALDEVMLRHGLTPAP